MMTKTSPKAAVVASPAANWRRDLTASLMLAAGVFVSTCVFAAAWAATHPQAFGA
jgi:hypothetical protein